MQSAQSLRARLDSLRKASQIAEVAAPPPPQEVKLTDAAAELPEHIRLVTPASKLNAQTPFFKCPAWADLPSKAYHLFATRDGVPFPALDLQRFPFYLLGKNGVCDYVLEHPSISSVHAVVVFHKAQNCFVLVDLGSTNGSRVNGKAVEARKPVPLPAGAVLQFGCSARQYTVCTGPPPSSKRIREEQEELLDARRKREETRATIAAAATAALAASVPHSTKDTSATGSEAPALHTSPPPAPQPEQAPAATNAVVTEAPDSTQAAVVALTSSTHAAEEATATTVHASSSESAELAAAERKRMHLFQLVIKHKDVKNPVSRGRNKGEVITRSAADALQMAQFILNQHNNNSTSSPSSGFVPWTVEAFTEMVLAYCEMSNPKKKGDLGIVEEGTFAPAFDRAAFALRRHEVSQPVETELGVHLIYRCD